MALTLPLLAHGAAAAPAALPAEQVEFFEKRIRPVLAERCFECHSEKKQKGDLRLDSRSWLMRGGSSGPAIAPGNPAASRLVEAVKYKHPDLKMPPKAKLPDAQIADLERWVQLGAPWPGAEAATPVVKGNAGPTSPETIARLQNEHWSLRPVTKPAPPPVRDRGWVRSPIDAFVLARLEERGLTPSPPADKAALLRRAYFDLIGLPPTYEQVQAFVADESPDAFARVIEQLLAMPQYGERWGRHWLDIARYSDTRGYQVGGAEIRYPYAYTYRDYVIDSFNADKPYDRFIIEQLAADKLDLGENKKPLAAMGFLTVGRQFLSYNDTVDDRIDVISRGLMGMTLACSRCHDHKFDPLPTTDYYALYGIIASSEEPKELPLIEEPGKTAGYLAFEKEMKVREQVLADYHAQVTEKVRDEVRSQVRDYLVFAAKVMPRANLLGRESTRTDRGEMRRRTLEAWMVFLRAAPYTDPVWAPWRMLRVVPSDQLATKASEVLAGFEVWESQKGHAQINPLVKEALRTKRPKTMVEVAEAYGDLLESVYADVKREAAEKKIDVAAVRLSDPAREQLRLALFAESSPAFLSQDDVLAQLSRDERNRQRALQSKIEQWKATSPATPPRAMVMVDKPRPVQPVVFVRGQPGNRGPSVSRRNLTVISHVDGGKAYESGSGRLELAQAIANRNNPLTARVMVNRIWLHHFGEGICRTPADFGVRADPPTHPELLDWLATAFMDSGWSVKAMHRMIMLSSTYQQAADDRSDCAAVDPENRLIWKMNRRRLEFEPMRDSLLAVAGRLDTAVGGKPVDIIKDHAANRRTIYAFINRQDMPGLLMNFDYPSPDVSTADRPRTTVPQQALFLMNSPFMAAQAKAVVDRAGLLEEAPMDEKVARLYRVIYSRDPQPREVAVARAFLQTEVQSPDKGKVPSWRKLAHAMLMSNEFIFVD